MDPLTSAAASGIRARLESLDMLANNIANASAPGFKADREFYGLYQSMEAASSPEGSDPSTLPVLERQWRGFSQGTVASTGHPLRLALAGTSLFAVDSTPGPL